MYYNGERPHQGLGNNFIKPEFENQNPEDPLQLIAEAPVSLHWGFFCDRVMVYPYGNFPFTEMAD